MEVEMKDVGNVHDDATTGLQRKKSVRVPKHGNLYPELFQGRRHRLDGIDAAWMDRVLATQGNGFGGLIRHEAHVHEIKTSRSTLRLDDADPLKLTKEDLQHDQRGNEAMQREEDKGQDMPAQTVNEKDSDKEIVQSGWVKMKWKSSVSALTPWKKVWVTAYKRVALPGEMELSYKKGDAAFKTLDMRYCVDITPLSQTTQVTPDKPHATHEFRLVMHKQDIHCSVTSKGELEHWMTTLNNMRATINGQHAHRLSLHVDKLEQSLSLLQQRFSRLSSQNNILTTQLKHQESENRCLRGRCEQANREWTRRFQNLETVVQGSLDRQQTMHDMLAVMQTSIETKQADMLRTMTAQQRLSEQRCMDDRAAMKAMMHEALAVQATHFKGMMEDALIKQQHTIMAEVKPLLMEGFDQQTKSINQIRDDVLPTILGDDTTLETAASVVGVPGSSHGTNDGAHEIDPERVQVLHALQKSQMATLACLSSQREHWLADIAGLRRRRQALRRDVNHCVELNLSSTASD